MKKNMLWFVVISILLLSGCSSAQTQSEGIHVTQATVAVGGADGSGNQQVVSYRVTLQNTSQNFVIVHWIEPDLNGDVSARLVGDSPRMSIEKTLDANSSLVIDGQFTFNSDGATKEEIASWEPFFEDVLISTEMKLALPSQES